MAATPSSAPAAITSRAPPGTRSSAGWNASGPADLLALVPSLLGFHPAESVVVLTLGDARHPFHARVDLPRDPVGIERLAGYLAEVASRHGVTRLAAALYTRDGRLADAVARELDHRLDRAGVDLACVVRADGERWWPFDGRQDSPGTPYDVRSHPLMARAVVEGTVVLGSRQELGDAHVGEPAEGDRVGGRAALRDTIGVSCGRPAGDLWACSHRFAPAIRPAAIRLEARRVER